MILVDTSVWVDHLRRGNRRLQHLLMHYSVLTHPFVIGELSLGNMGNRERVLSHLDRLPACTVASNDEVRYFIERNHLAGQGVGYVDAHLLAAAALTAGTRLWTLDKNLGRAASRLGMAG